MEEKNIHSMTYSEILDYCEKLQEKWCTDANRKYCSILQAGRCPKQFSKEKECDSLSHHFENNNWCTELEEDKEVDWYIVEYKKNPITYEGWDDSMLLGNEKSDSFLINSDILNESNWYIRYEKFDNGSIDTFDFNAADLYIN